METDLQHNECCPACERYIGPVLSCPYCDAASAGRRFLLWFRVSALVLGVAGVFILLFIARMHEVPLRSIEEVGPTMNFAQVRIRGVIERAARMSGEGSAYISFVVNDGTGTIFVSAYGETANQLKEKSEGIRVDAEVEVCGIVNVRAGRLPGLIVKRAQDFMLMPHESEVHGEAAP